MKKILLVAIALLSFTFGVSGQTLGFSANEELMTKYFWRGMAAGNFPGPVAPGGATDVGLNFTSADENFYMESYFWTFHSMSVGDWHYAEYQFTIYTEFHGVHLEMNHYFGDMGEIGIGYTLPGVVPASLTFYTTLWGDDYDMRVNSLKRMYSNYMELTVPYNVGKWDFQLTFGAVPHRSFYYDNDGGFAVNNMLAETTYTFELSDILTMPVKLAGGYSPLYKTPIYYATVGLSVNF